jgi:hypothetical protein
MLADASACVPIEGSFSCRGKHRTTILAPIDSNLKMDASCNSSSSARSNPKSPRSSDLPSILHIRRSRSGGCAFSLSEVAGLYVCSVATVSRFLALGQTPTLTLSAAESSAAAHSAGKVDTRPSHEPSPVHMSSRKRGHKLSRSDHGKARGTVCIFFVVLAGSSP